MALACMVALRTSPAARGVSLRGEIGLILAAPHREELVCTARLTEELCARSSVPSPCLPSGACRDPARFSVTQRGRPEMDLLMPHIDEQSRLELTRE